MTEDTYFRYGELLGDLGTFCTDLYDILYTNEYYDEQARVIVYVYDREKIRYRHVTRLCKQLASAVGAINVVFKHYDKADDLSKGIGARLRRGNKSQRAQNLVRINIHTEVAETKRLEALDVIGRLYLDQKESLDGVKWRTKQMHVDADWWLRALDGLTTPYRNGD